MLEVFKKIFHDPDEETISIFEKNTKIEYEPTIFSSLTVLSLTHTNLNNLHAFSVFANLTILNLSHNRVQDINTLKNLKKLKIIDLRFNQIKTLPSWVFKSDKIIYWERVDEEKEGIYLEGNPLDKKLISKIKNFSTKKKSSKKKRTLQLPKLKKMKNEQEERVEPLQALKRQKVTLFLPQLHESDFTNSLSLFNRETSRKDKFKLNISIIRYTDRYKTVNPIQAPSQKLEYIILILKEIECCLNPPILEALSQRYVNSKIFLIIENDDHSNIEQKITFFKTYTKSINTIEVYHSLHQDSNREIVEKIYNYLEHTPEANSLWCKNWIALRDEIEEDSLENINNEDFQVLAKKYSLPQEISDDVFSYLKRVGSIKEDLIF